MDRGLKQMLWMSWTLRSQILCSNYTVSNLVNQNISNKYWTNNKDTLWSEKLEPVKRIMQQSEAHSTKDSLRILNTINNKCLNMDLKDTMDILTALVKISKEDTHRIDFMNHEGFQMLCGQLKKQIRLMSLTEVLDSLKLLTFLNVPASTVIMQNLLQIIRNSINDLQIDQIHLMLCLLKKMESTSLSSALLIALPILLPSIINSKVDYYDLHELSIALFRIKHEEQQDLIIKICKNIQLIIKNNPTAVPIYIIKNLFSTLCYMSPKRFNSAVMIDTLVLVKETLFHKVHRFGSGDIIECIHAISHGVINGNMTAYNSAIVTSLLEVAMSKQIDFYLGSKVLKHLNNMQYVYEPFLEYLLNRTLSDDISSYKLSIFLNAFCICDYKSVPWDYIENKILESSFLSSCSTKNLLQCTVCLAALDKYYPQLLSAVFIKTHVKNLMALEDNITQIVKLLSIYQSVKSLYVEYKGPWPSKETLDYIYKMAYSSKRNVLKNQLNIAIGGPQYVLSNLRTKIGHFIDYAIIMRKGGYPIAFNTNNSEVLANYSNYVEDLQCPPESYVILILEFPRTAYSINTLHLTNTKKLQIKTLEKWTGHKCIDVNLNMWENLPNHEKTSYLMQKIRNECDDIIPDM